MHFDGKWQNLLPQFLVDTLLLFLFRSRILVYIKLCRSPIGKARKNGCKFIGKAR